MHVGSIDLIQKVINNNKKREYEVTRKKEGRALGELEGGSSKLTLSICIL